MVPTIALVGRNNVGKSALFNRLTCSQDALVSGFSGLTRDRKYGSALIDGYKCIFIDTGIGNMKDLIGINICKQTSIAITESDVLLFIVDAQDGLMPEDSIISNIIRSYKKKIFLVINKIEGIDINKATSDFWKLGFSNIYPISASHGMGIDNLLDNILKYLKKYKYLEENNKNNKNWENLLINKIKTKELGKNYNLSTSVKVAIVGRSNVGKSTLINTILNKDRVIVCHIPGTTRDSIYIPLEYNKNEYTFIDTAGVSKNIKIKNSLEKIFILKTLKVIKGSDVTLLIIDANHGISDHDLFLIKFIINNYCSLVIAFNKWDNITDKKIQNDIVKKIRYRLKFINFVQIHFISALYGKGIKNLLKSINEAYDSCKRHISTSLLTNLMNKATEKHQPPLFNKKYNVKLRYAHIGSYNPLMIIIHGNKTRKIPSSYKKYLINFFSKSLKIRGNQIHIQFKEKNNSYSNNKLYKLN